MKKSWISVLCLILGPIWVHAQVVPLDLGLREKPLGPYTSLTTWTLDRPRLGLALSGGGARGLAQIGVLQELERQAIPVDRIAGTSMGAIIGGLYAVGYSAAEIESVAVAFRWDELIRNTPPRQQVFLSRKDASERHLFELHFHNLHLELPSALSSGQQLTSLLTQLVYGAPTPPFTRFDDFPIPFRAVATDLITGEKVVLSSGSLVDAMRASMAIPLLFTPMAYNGHQLVDGGLVDNLPVEEVRRMGADKVIAVDTSSPLHNAEALETPWIVADQATTIMMRRQRHLAMALADTVLCPELGTLANTDFSDANAIIESGRQAGRQLAQSLDHWLLSQPSGALQKDTAKRLILNGLNDAYAAQALTLMGLDTLALASIPASKLVLALQRLAISGDYRRVEADLDTLAQTWRVHLEANPTIQSIHFEGNRCFPDSTLLERLDLQLPGPLNTLALQSGVDRVLRLYREQGYCLAQIDTLWFEQGQLTLRLDEGKIERIDLMGVRHTRPYVILREIPFKPGQRLRSAKLTQAMEQIYSTGYFDEVRLSTNPGENDHHLLFTIKEKDHGIFRMGMRYDTDRKLAGFLEVAKDNFLGFGVQSAVTALAGHQDLDLAFRLWSDRLFYSYTPFSLELRTGRHKDGYYRNFEEIGRYETAIQSACFSSGQQMGRLGTVSVRLTAEHAEISPLSGPESPSGDLRILSLGIRSEVDTRDQRAFTRKGIHHILDYESSGRLLGSNTGYTRLESLFESFFSTQRFWTFHPRLHWGTSDLTTPFHKQFKLGGPLSFPALPENALRGRRFVALCTEVILHLPPLFWHIEPHLSIRGDVAGAWEHYDAIKTDDFLRSLTFTLGSETLLGPFILGYSLMENRNHYLFFSLGHRFPLR